MNDDQLRRLLSDAVSDIDPDDRIEDLRASLHRNPRTVPLIHTRPWYAAAAIVAAVIGVVAFVTSVAGDKSSDLVPTTHGRSGPPSPTATATDTSAPSPSSSASQGGGTKTYAVYYVGTDPKDKPVLFREFHRGDESKPTNVLVADGLQTAPTDPDYSTPWRTGDLLGPKANPDAGVILVTLGHASLEHRPVGMTAAYARAAVQQVVYSLQAAFETRLPVQFMFHAAPARSVLGVTASEPIAQAKVLDTLSHISISSPNDGAEVSGRLRVTGVNNGFEGTVAVYLEQNGRHYLQKATIGGTIEDKLFPWGVTLDLSKVTPGTYTLVAQNDNSNDQGSGPHTPERDTRVIRVE